MTKHSDEASRGTELPKEVSVDSVFAKGAVLSPLTANSVSSVGPSQRTSPTGIDHDTESLPEFKYNIERSLAQLETYGSPASDEVAQLKIMLSKVLRSEALAEIQAPQDLATFAQERAQEAVRAVEAPIRERLQAIEAQSQALQTQTNSANEQHRQTERDRAEVQLELGQMKEELDSLHRSSPNRRKSLEQLKNEREELDRELTSLSTREETVREDMGVAKQQWKRVRSWVRSTKELLGMTMPELESSNSSET